MGLETTSIAAASNYNANIYASNPRIVRKKEKSSQDKTNILIATGVGLGAIGLGCLLAKKSLSKLKLSLRLYSNPELKKVLNKDTFKNLKIFENLNTSEKESLYKGLLGFGDERFFFPTVSGHKPACIVAAINRDFKCLSKIKDKNLEFIHLEPHKFGRNNSLCYNTYVLNKKLVLETIERNKDIYTTRLNLSQKASNEEIYSKLKDVLKSTKGEHDIEGLTLGFPRKSCMIFHLEQVGGISYELRSKPEEYKKAILEVLRSKNSPYKNLPKKTIKDLEKSINEISVSDERLSPYMDFVNYVNEPQEFERIRKAAENFDKTFKAE